MMFVSKASLLLVLSLLLVACGNQDAGSGSESVDAPPPIPPSEALDACVLTPPKEPMACTMEYDPVCGCDGKTYGNACMARGAGVPRFEPGECEASNS